MEHDAQSSRRYKENWDDAVQVMNKQDAEIARLQAARGPRMPISQNVADAVAEIGGMYSKTALDAAVDAAVAAERTPDAVIRRALIVAAFHPCNSRARASDLRSAAVALFGIDAVLDATAGPNVQHQRRAAQ